MNDPIRLTTAGTLSALDRARLRSSMVRTVAVVAALALSLVAMVVRRESMPTDERFAYTWGPMAIAFAGICYEVFMLVILTRALQRDVRPSTMLHVITAIVESSTPTAAMLFIWYVGMLSPYHALISPAILVYPFVMTLSVLQLQPTITLIVSVLCSGQHLALVIIADRQNAFDDPASLPPATMYAYSFVLVVLGLGATFTARRVRGYVEDAVRETTQRLRTERELRAASEVQSRVLPSEPPAMPGLTIAGWNRQAKSVGGDYYDWVELDDGRVVVSLADVSGHGIAPALLTAYCRAYARSLFRNGGSLGESLVRLNELVEPDLPPGRFVTYVAVMLTPDEDCIRLVSAGHGPMFIHRAASSTVERLNANLAPLGVLPTLDVLPPVERTLDVGDTLILLTDGVFEWANIDGERWGNERLEASILAHGGREPHGLINAIVHDAEAFAHMPQEDDVTVVVIRRYDGTPPPRDDRATS